MSKIKNIKAREILDSRGNPTVEVDVILESGYIATASVPSGASTGINEAIELRDNNKDRYLGKGVLKAVSNVNEIIRPRLLGMDVLKQREIDDTLIKLDGTKNKSKLGANAILGVSLACLKAGALYKNQELYEYIGKGTIIPRPMMNILNGGVHALNGLDFQEFMIMPMTKDFRTNLRMGAEIFHNLKKILNNEGYNTGVGDEGGFAPSITSTEEAINLIIDAIKVSGYTPGKDVYIALDVASSEFYNDGKYSFEGMVKTSKELIDYYEYLCEKYPIISIEDAMAEDDYDGWKLITSKLGHKVQLVGDDLFVTNKELFQKGINECMANAILIKPNQIGTVTETIDTILLAKKARYNIIISHRSGETEDTYIADLAVGLNIGQIKTGSLCRGERTAKYNRLLRIFEKIYRN